MPNEPDYQLVVIFGKGQVETLSLDRTEYKALRRRLSQMREDARPAPREGVRWGETAPMYRHAQG